MAFPPQVRIHDNIMWSDRGNVKISDRITPHGVGQTARPGAWPFALSASPARQTDEQVGDPR